MKVNPVFGLLGLSPHVLKLERQDPVDEYLKLCLDSGEYLRFVLKQD